MTDRQALALVAMYMRQGAVPNTAIAREAVRLAAEVREMYRRVGLPVPS